MARVDVALKEWLEDSSSHPVDVYRPGLPADPVRLGQRGSLWRH